MQMINLESKIDALGLFGSEFNILLEYSIIKSALINLITK